MPYKPLSVKLYQQYIKRVGWSLIKAGIDWKLLNSNGQMMCTIIICHGKNTKEEVIAYSVKKTENLFKQRGMPWPPKKK